MRVAALYDIHGNPWALDAVLAEVDADLIVVGGDVAPGPDVDGCFERLDALDVPVRWVMGNGDREELDARRLARFEPTVEVGGALFCHGSPRRASVISFSISGLTALALASVVLIRSCSMTSLQRFASSALRCEALRESW